MILKLSYDDDPEIRNKELDGLCGNTSNEDNPESLYQNCNDQNIDAVNAEDIQLFASAYIDENGELIFSPMPTSFLPTI